ncbi:MAG: hypothetical protein E7271_01875 [Lachnospiraceae bacterium]|jgi:hypothetical protein|nr:hypothetical protein [Lachnospiraceae bacterium]
MIAKCVERERFDLFTRSIKTVYNTSAFNELNKYKVSKIIYIIIYKEESPRFAVACGCDDDEKEVCCPYSAPFGYIEPIKKEQSVNSFYEAIKAFENLIYRIGYKKISITLPPDFYDNQVINCWYNVFLSNGWLVDFADINYELALKDLIDDYHGKVKYNAKKNLKTTLKYNFKISECVSNGDIKEAYSIIKRNRQEKGYPLKMTEEQVLETMKVVPSEMYMVSLDNNNIASALVYEVTTNIAQVIYWGELIEHSESRVMNYLAYELIKVYANKGFEYLDIGPSTEYGKPNYGLCDFKESIGCLRTVKFRFYKKLSDCVGGIKETEE